MTEPAALQKLLTWLSPAFPVGAFAWSAGLETAIAERRVLTAEALGNWIDGALAHGGLRTDAILLAHAHRAVSVDTPLPSSPMKGEVPSSVFGSILPNPPEGTLPFMGRVGEGVSTTLRELAELCLALTPAAERRREMLVTGEAFATAARAWPSDVYAKLPEPCPYPIAVGAIAAAHGIGPPETLIAYLTAAVQSQASVAVRLVPLGQTDALRVIASREPQIAALAQAAATASLDDIGGIAYAADIAQMRHETLEPRIFRS
jgi:urease accessory protein